MSRTYTPQSILRMPSTEKIQCTTPVFAPTPRNTATINSPPIAAPCSRLPVAVSWPATCQWPTKEDGSGKRRWKLIWKRVWKRRLKRRWKRRWGNEKKMEKEDGVRKEDGKEDGNVNFSRLISPEKLKSEKRAF